MAKPSKRLTTQFGKKVKKALIEYNLTQHDLALKLGISDSYLCDILKSDKKAVKYKKIICHILNINESYIYS